MGKSLPPSFLPFSERLLGFLAFLREAPSSLSENH